MPATGAPKPREIPASAYTAEGLADIWTGSYRFSQGSKSLQQNLVGYACDRIIPAAVLDDTATLDRSFELAKRTVLAVISSGKHLTVEYDAIDIGQDFGENVIGPIETEKEQRNEPGFVLRNIVRETLGRDAQFLPANDNHNIRDFKPRAFSSPGNRYFSYTVRYLLLKPSVHPVFGRIFEQARVHVPRRTDYEVPTYDWINGTIRMHGNTFQLQDILDAHIDANQLDREPVEQALAELGIETVTKKAASPPHTNA